MPECDVLFTARLSTLWSLVRPGLEGVGLAHDEEHVLRVTRWAIHLARVGKRVDPELAGATGLVHDLVQVPKESEDRARGGEWSAVAGREPLRAAGFRHDEIDQIVEAVRTSSWSRGLAPETDLGAVLQDADRLDAIGVIGIARNFACAQEMSQRSGMGRFYDPEDPFGHTGRVLDDRKNALDHWSLKLLRLVEGMHTECAREEAALRHRSLLRLRSELERELKSPLDEPGASKGEKR